jgi:hypothetical protein
MKTLRYALFICLSVALTECGMFANSGSTTTNLNNMEGWHFHVCSNETKASRVWFEVSGTGDNSMYQSSEIKWTSGKESFLSVPEAMRHMDDMNLSIRTSGNRKAKICVLYGTYVIKSIEVSGTETNKVTKENRDNCPC